MASVGRDRTLRVVAAVSAAGVTVAVAASSAPALKATVDARAAGAAGSDVFAFDWIGHTRDLKILRSGLAKETLYAGCCDHIVDVHFHVGDPHGSLSAGSLRARVTGVKVFDRSGASRLPRRGQTTRFRIRNGVLTEPLTGIIYCDNAAELKGKCGA
jgi:hypothetical protein